MRRFLLPLPCALLLSFLIWEARYVIEDGWVTAGRLALPTALWGLASFPMGLAAPWLPRELLKTAAPWICLAGYGLYIGLSLMALKRGSTRMGTVLIVLLLLNMISCQIQAPAIQKAIGLE